MGIVSGLMSVVAANMAGSALPTHIAIGTGSATFSSAETTLVSELERNQIDTKDLSTTAKVTFVANWSPLDISGAIVKEFGTFTTGSVMLNRENLAGSQVFDGEQELQVQQTFQIYI